MPSLTFLWQHNITQISYFSKLFNSFLALEKIILLLLGIRRYGKGYLAVLITSWEEECIPPTKAVISFRTLKLDSHSFTDMLLTLTDYYLSPSLPGICSHPHLNRWGISAKLKKYHCSVLRLTND